MKCDSQKLFSNWISSAQKLVSSIESMEIDQVFKDKYITLISDCLFQIQNSTNDIYSYYDIMNSCQQYCAEIMEYEESEEDENGESVESSEKEMGPVRKRWL